jgi:hypothetical protein
MPAFQLGGEHGRGQRREGKERCAFFVFSTCLDEERSGWVERESLTA